MAIRIGHCVTLMAMVIVGVICQSAQEELCQDMAALSLCSDDKLKELRSAIDKQDQLKVQQLIKADAPYTYPAVFAHACRSCNRDLVKLFLVHGVQSNVPDEIGWYPIHHAASVGSKSIVQLLHQSGVPYSQPTQELSDTALHIAAYCGYVDLVKFLIMVTPEHLYTKRPEGDRLAHHIAASGNIALMQWHLRAKERDIDHVDRHGMRPIFVAALHGHIDMVKYLLKRRPQHLKAKSHDGCTLLTAAVHQNHEELIEYLRSLGLRLSDKAHNGSTPAHVAAAHCYKKLVQQAIEMDSLHPLSPDSKGWSLIHYAAQGGCLHTIQMLHEIYDVPLNLAINAKEKKTVIDIAVENNHAHILAYLRKQGICPSEESEEGGSGTKARRFVLKGKLPWSQRKYQKV